jgi:hypothetical protein
MVVSLENRLRHRARRSLSTQHFSQWRSSSNCSTRWRRQSRRGLLFLNLLGPGFFAFPIHLVGLSPFPTNTLVQVSGPQWNLVPAMLAPIRHNAKGSSLCEQSTVPSDVCRIQRSKEMMGRRSETT